MIIARARNTKLTISLRKSLGLLMPAGFSIFSSSSLSAYDRKFLRYQGHDILDLESKNPHKSHSDQKYFVHIQNKIPNKPFEFLCQ